MKRLTILLTVAAFFLVPRICSASFDFAMDFLAVDGNILGVGNPDNVFDFFDNFNDESLTISPTSSFLFSQGLTATDESGGFLRFRSADGALTTSRFGLTFIEDDAFLNIPLTKGAGNSEILASFRADTPSGSQFYGIGVVNSGFVVLESVAIFVQTRTDQVTRVFVGDHTGTIIASDPVTLPPGGFVLFKLFVNDATNQVVASYSLDNGASFKQDTQFAFFARHGTILNATSSAFVFAQGGEVIPGRPPTLFINPSSLDFGTVPLGATKDLTFTVKNTGDGTLTGSARASAPFIIVGDSFFSLTANQIKNITVRFVSRSPGLSYGNVSFTTNGGNASPTVQGSGVRALSLAVRPPRLDFGTLSVGEVKDLVFTVQNTGDGTLTGSARASAPFSIVGDGSFSLTANQTKDIMVRFSPASANTFAGNVTITSNGGNASWPSLTGKAVSVPFITDISPVSGPAGAAVTISGFNFGSRRGMVKFGSRVATINLWTDTQIKVTVPSIAPGTADATVIIAGVVSNPMPFSISAPAPIITGINKTIGTPGDEVIILGRNFGSVRGTVTFGSTNAEISQWTNNRVTVRVPSRTNTSGFPLSFPLDRLSSTTAPINSVFDHYMSTFYSSGAASPARRTEEANVVQAFSGEIGRKENGGGCGGTAPGFKKNPQGDPFTLGGLAVYWGNPCGTSFLQYDGHPAYDYAATRGTPIFAAAAGRIRIPRTGNDSVYSNPSRFNAIVVVHDNGFETWYLHAKTLLKRDGDLVTENDAIATVGCTGLTNCNYARPTGPDHLHFEVRRTDVVILTLAPVESTGATQQFTYSIPVDPYGWKGTPPDPYTKAENVPLWKE